MLPKSNFRFYRDTGIALLGNLNRQQTDRVRKNIIGVFKDIRFLVLGLKLVSKK